MDDLEVVEPVLPVADDAFWDEETFGQLMGSLAALNVTEAFILGVLLLIVGLLLASIFTHRLAA